MKSETAIRQKALCIAMLMMVLTSPPGLLQAQSLEIDIDLQARFDIRELLPENLQVRHTDLPDSRIARGDKTLHEEVLTWLEVSSTENLDLLVKIKGEHPVYYINTGVFDPHQAESFAENIAFRLNRNNESDATTGLFKAWIGIRPWKEGLLSINHN